VYEQQAIAVIGLHLVFFVPFILGGLYLLGSSIVMLCREISAPPPTDEEMRELFRNDVDDESQYSETTSNTEVSARASKDDAALKPFVVAETDMKHRRRMSAPNAVSVFAQPVLPRTQSMGAMPTMPQNRSTSNTKRAPNIKVSRRKRAKKRWKRAFTRVQAVRALTPRATAKGPKVNEVANDSRQVAPTLSHKLPTARSTKNASVPTPELPPDSLLARQDALRRHRSMHSMRPSSLSATSIARRTTLKSTASMNSSQFANTFFSSLDTSSQAAQGDEASVRSSKSARRETRRASIGTPYDHGKGIGRAKKKREQERTQFERFYKMAGMKWQSVHLPGPGNGQ